MAISGAPSAPTPGQGSSVQQAARSNLLLEFDEINCMASTPEAAGGPWPAAHRRRGGRPSRGQSRDRKSLGQSCSRTGAETPGTLVDAQFTIRSALSGRMDKIGSA